MVKVTLKDGTVVEGTSEEIYALDLFVETDVVESVEKIDETALKVGDRVRTLYSDEDGDIPVGSYGSVTRINSGISPADPFHIKVVTDDDFGYYRPEYLEVVTEADAVFMANRRKPNEYRKGDIVRILNSPSPANEIGDIGVVTAFSVYNVFSVEVKGRDTDGNWQTDDDVEPIVFVENRLDRN